jgi:hypothetical protein
MMTDQDDKNIMRGKMSNPLVSIVMGSDSDLEIMREAGKALEEFGIAYEMDVTSAHRSPDRTAEFARGARERGIRVIIAGAGGAAHLAGVFDCAPGDGLSAGDSADAGGDSGGDGGDWEAWGHERRNSCGTDDRSERQRDRAET